MSVDQTELYSVLDAKCDANEAHQLSGPELLGMVVQATRSLGDCLNRASTNFSDYTLHDEHHAERVVFLMHRLLGDEMVARLSVIDLTLLILSAYAHDTGMAVGRTQRDELEQSDAYRDFVLRNEGRWSEAQEAKADGQNDLFRHLNSQLFQDFLRGIHHEQSAELVQGQFADQFLVGDKSLAPPVAALCRSHGQGIDDVAKMKRFPFAGPFHADMPFLACVLRLADYLDLDAIRAPASLLAIIDPTNEISRREWRKHQANSFYVTSQQIEFSAEFDNFFEEKALRDTLAGLEHERRECMELLQSRPETEFKLLLDSKVAFSLNTVRLSRC